MNWVPDFILRFFGRKIGDSFHLQEGTLDGTKPWYTSKTIWASIVSGLIGTYLALIQQGIHLPSIPAWLITLLGAIGVYTRSTATDKISS